MGIIWGCLILGGMITLFSEEEKYKNIIFRTFNHQNSNNIINQLETKKNVMMPINNNGNREQERAELYKTIWQIANDLRGSVDGWDFKQYVLGFLFYRFISENLTHYINEQERKHNPDFDYAQLSDEQAEFGRADTVREKGFFILPSELFRNVQARAKSDSNLNETLSRIFRNIENSAKGTESESDLKGLFDDVDLNSNKLGNSVEKRNQKLVKLIDAIGNMPLSNGKFTENTIDLFGDAYEFLMTMYASNAGKSGGEFFTPQEVSELLARIATVGKTEVNKVYDPACGSGSLLLKFSKILGKDKVRIGYFGQEINLTTYNLCRINMFLHNINYNFFDIAHGDTLTDPKHWDDEPFDAIVSNPPYSINWEGDKNQVLINDPRFAPAGVLAPKSKADLAFVMHMLAWLSPSGTAAIVCFPGVLYRGGAEQKIRKYLVDNNYVDCVIQLPPDLFFGTTIATCILVLKKNKRDNHLLFIDASEEFVRSGNKNKLTEGNIAKIMGAYTERTDVEHFARLVHNDEIGKNDYNMAVSGYVARKEEREEVDIDKLNAEITEIVARQQKLRAAIDEIVRTLQ
ncbi:MAG: type I restriction-modification system subunit M [Bacteroidales bacterium]